MDSSPSPPSHRSQWVDQRELQHGPPRDLPDSKPDLFASRHKSRWREVWPPLSDVIGVPLRCPHSAIVLDRGCVESEVLHAVFEEGIGGHT